MGLAGKYDFIGIKRAGGLGLATLLGSTPYGAIVLKIPVIGTLIRGALELFCNWLANNGLIVLNVGAIATEGQWDQKQFDDHMIAAFKAVEVGAGKLTPKEVKSIDDEVIKYFRQLGVVTKHN